MYLSKLELFGFKSFAQKIDLSFDEGLTAIVGPNGCGKTNVVDAIRWALGEQRPTTLRSDKMEDVIFNGTKSRKPLSMAEVSLTIENTRNILPTEYSEVTITRRVYRSGESEYFLNKTLCRLKDIRNLFMDTGMGSDAYSVIELKMVETILSDKAEERRRLFEEAAGVTKYKHRRKETYRRLDGVQRDLQRVNDIVREVQKAVNALERQAQKAEKYNELARMLHELELDLLSREYASVISRILPLEEQLAKALTERSSIDGQLKQAEALVDVHRSELTELEDRSASVQTSVQKQLELVHRLEQTKATGGERQRAINLNIEKYQEEKLNLAHRRKELEEHQRDWHGRLNSLASDIEKVKAGYQERKRELEEFSTLLEQRQLERNSLQEKVIAILHEVSELKGKEGEARAKIENLRGRIEFISEEAQGLRADIAKNTELVDRLSTEDKKLRHTFAQAEVRAHEAERTRDMLQKEIADLRDRELELKTSIERRSARSDFLKGLVESHDGIPEGARHLLSAAEWKSTAMATVGEIIEVEQRFRVAIESALNETVGYVVVRAVDDAYGAIEFLKRSNKGKATFICLDRIPRLGRQDRLHLKDGVLGWASEMVRSAPPYDRLTRFLLDGVIVVQDLESARSLVSRHGSAVRCVTLEGDVVTSGGVVRGGSKRQDEGGHIGRKTQLAEIEREIDQLHGKHSQLRKTIELKQQQLLSLDPRKTHEQVKEIEQKTTALEIRIAQLEFEKKRAAENIERGSVESKRLTDEIELLSKELKTLSPHIRDRDSARTQQEERVAAANAELKAMEQQWEHFSQMTGKARDLVTTTEGEASRIRQDLEHTADTIATIDGTMAQREADVEASRTELENLSNELKETERLLSHARKDLDLHRGSKKEVDQEVTAKRKTLHEIELRLKDDRQRHEGSLRLTHELEMKVAELKSKADGLKGKARDEFEIELQLRSYDDNARFDFERARDQVRVTKEKIRGLGPVNFAAFDEYKSEKERLDFVLAQRKDLVDSEKTLLETIEEINTTAQRQFMETFDQIRDNFISTFKGLFDEGDECDLKLEEGVDPLEARIEITAKPRGKRPTSIDLLSGGEKTLTAIALLFAIYLVKPSPFCILDEVDAPLDDSNIDRFTRILRKFSDNTQFVVVTHNKRTMEAANALYGVTMEEEGISKLVSVRFNEPVPKER